MMSKEELEKMFGDVKVDTENNCIDRSTPLGQYFEDALNAAKEEPNPNKAVFMQQILAYTEATLIITHTMPKEEADKALEQLRVQMGIKPE